MASKVLSRTKSRSGAKKSARPSARPADFSSPKLSAKLVQIGNSRGVRLPKSVIEQAGLTEDVELSVEDGKVIITSIAPKPNPREGWEEMFRAAVAEHGDDIDEWRDWQNISNEFDKKEWTW